LSNSNLATYLYNQTGNFNARTSSITGIIIHNAVTIGTCEDLAKILSSTDSGSFNYGIATDGTIGLYVDEMYRPWSTGDPTIDHKTVSIMVCNSSLSGNYPISQATYSSLIDLCEDICRRNFISELRYTSKNGNGNLYMHSWYADVNCPGPYLSAKYPSIAQEVTTRLKVTQNNSTTAALANSSGATVDKLNPYIVCVDPSVAKVNYDKLITAKVVGAIFYAGSLYSEGSKTPKDVYQSSRLKTQLTELDGKMPFGLYCDVRAWDVKSAKLECKQLYYVISNYPPKLGIWLNLHFGGSVSTNDEVLETYYRYLTEWGLKSKCGLYCDRTQLGRVSWASNFCRKYSLWLIDHTAGVVTDIGATLSPSSFKV